VAILHNRDRFFLIVIHSVCLSEAPLVTADQDEANITT